MANKPMKICLIMRERKNQNTSEKRLHLQRMTTLKTNTRTKKPENNKHEQDVEIREPLCSVGGNVKWCSPCRKQKGGSSTKPSSALP
jgi:hypothetical protein